MGSIHFLRGLPGWLAVLLLAGSAANLPLAGAERTPWTTSRVKGSPLPPAPYRVVPLFPERKFEGPVELGRVPGTDWWMIAEQGGKIWTFSESAPTRTNALAADLRPHHTPFDNVLGFTFHPRFSSNRFIYINYNETANRTNGAHVSRFTVRPTSPPTIDLASEKVVIQWLSGGHNGCTLAFGNDGYLYISTGDAANPDPPDIPYKTGQDNSDLLSCVLRIDVDRPDGTNAYSIPGDNPFRGLAGTRPEIWAFGFRNPWRMSFDRVTGDLWLGDVGFEQWEMIYRIRRGGNYGWSLVEGPNRDIRSDVTQGPGEILPPLISLPHHEAASITGGLVYRGRKFPALVGAYVYGDWETGKFWAARNQGDTLLSNLELCDTILKPVSFAADARDELVILDYQGGLYTLETNTADASNQQFPRRLSESGLFQDLVSLRPSPGVEPYQPAGQMWNDYARAVFHLGIPGLEQISTFDGRQTIAGRMWFFPSNTVFSRTLFLAPDQLRPTNEIKVETQLLHFDGQGWNPYSYRWNGAQTDADLVPAEGTNTVFKLTNAPIPGVATELPWRFSGRSECLRCHNAWAGETLSFGWFQLMGDKKGDSISEADRLVKSGFLQMKEPPELKSELVDPRDEAASLTARARAWLHLNCAPCHRNGAGGNVPAHLNLDQQLSQTRALDAVPTRGDFGIAGARIIAPGEPARSTLFYRIATEGAGHMPLIGSRLVDEDGLGLIHDWIKSLSASNAANAPLLSGPLANMTGALQWVGNDNAQLRRMAANPNKAGLPVFATLRNQRLRMGQAAAAQTNHLIRDLFQRFLPSDQRRVTLGAEFSSDLVLQRRGDAQRGRDLFLGVAQCARCHLAAGAGRPLGPDLAGVIKRFPRAQLLEQLVLPSKVIHPEFRLATITLKDDTELTGYLTGKGTPRPVLRLLTGEEQVLAPSNIVRVEESPLSAMPEGLLAPLTPQEAADLLEYLSTL